MSNQQAWGQEAKTYACLQQLKLFPYQIECKNKATSQIHTYYKQAKSHGKHEPLVVVHMDRNDTLAIVSWEHFQTLIKK